MARISTHLYGANRGDGLATRARDNINYYGGFIAPVILGAEFMYTAMVGGYKPGDSIGTTAFKVGLAGICNLAFIFPELIVGGAAISVSAQQLNESRRDKNNKINGRPEASN